MIVLTITWHPSPKKQYQLAIGTSIKLLAYASYYAPIVDYGFYTLRSFRYQQSYRTEIKLRLWPTDYPDLNPISNGAMSSRIVWDRSSGVGKFLVSQVFKEGKRSSLREGKWTLWESWYRWGNQTIYYT